jgi:hypothetical protein
MRNASLEKRARPPRTPDQQRRPRAPFGRESGKRPGTAGRRRPGSDAGRAGGRRPLRADAAAAGAGAAGRGPQPPRARDRPHGARGYPNKTIADVLEISSWTVGTYLRCIFAKLNVGSRAAIVALLAEQGLLKDRREPGDSGNAFWG